MFDIVIWKDSQSEDIDLAIAISLAEEEGRGKHVISDDLQLKEDEKLTRALQEGLKTDSPPRNRNVHGTGTGNGNGNGNGNIYQTIQFLYSIGFRICAGCNYEIGHGRFLSCMGAVWHPECFRCHACNQPTTDYEFSMSRNYPYDQSCYKDHYHPKCDFCQHFIPTNAAGLIEYRAHPFWAQKYCSFHEHDGTPRCCSCERMEGHYHMLEMRGLYLSEEQTVSTVLRRPRLGMGNRVTDMRTEPLKLTRRCEVTAILILYGLPRLLIGSILAHEMVHAWLQLQGYPRFSQDVEKGICQVLAHMWLRAQIAAMSSGSGTTPSTSSSAMSSRQGGRRSPFDKKLAEFFKHQIEFNMSSVYRNGFRTGNQAVIKYRHCNLKSLFYSVIAMKVELHLDGIIIIGVYFTK